MFDSIDEAEEQLREQRYFVDREAATAIFLAARLGKPLFVEGDAGSGKTDLARALAATIGTELLRLQCHEGLTEEQALYEWNLAKQLLRMKLAAAAGQDAEEAETEVFGPEYLLSGPLLQAITNEGDSPPVLLIDEVDRVDAEFEAFLLEFLTNYEVTIPQIGPVRAERPPIVVLTSNRTRDVDDALKRHCLYLWLGHPGFEREHEIVMAVVPGMSAPLAGQLCNFMDLVRQEDFENRPGLAETLDWGRALVALHKTELDRETVNQTLGCFFKSVEDIEQFRSKRYWERMRPRLDATG